MIQIIIPTLANALFGSVKLTKIAHIDKHKYSGYGIGFDGKNIIQLVMNQEKMQ